MWSNVSFVNNIKAGCIQFRKVSPHYTQNRHSLVSSLRTLSTEFKVLGNYHSQIPFLVCCCQYHSNTLLFHIVLCIKFVTKMHNLALLSIKPQQSTTISLTIDQIVPVAL